MNGLRKAAFRAQVRSAEAKNHGLRNSAIVLAALLLVALAACRSERLVTPAVQSTARVTVRQGADLKSIGTALGWRDGTVPDAVVGLQSVPEDSSEASQYFGAKTDSDGIAVFASVPPGTYSVSISRRFSTTEYKAAHAVIGGLFDIEGRGSVTILPGDTATRLDVTVHGVGAGSLVFDEIFNVYAQLGSVPGVYTEFAEYVEVYNNSDTTVQLAGKLFLQGMARGIIGGKLTCSDLSTISGDPAGIWAEWVYRFPPTARPLAPGAFVLIATDALDFRQFGTGAGLQDLSHADFEFRGSSDTDNPLAQDMISVGPTDGGTPFGHGWISFTQTAPIALADNLNLDTLPHIYEPILNGGSTWVRIPKAALIDVATTRTTRQSAYQDCPPEVDPGIDAGEARLLADVDSLSLHRRISDTLPDGRLRFQQSRNSAADFYKGPQTPGRLP